MTKIGTAVGALILSAMMLTAVPAQAAESRSLGAKSCSSGGVATEGRSNTTQTHRHNANERRFTNTSGAFRPATYYGGLRSVSSSSVSTSGDGFFATPAPAGLLRLLRGPTMSSAFPLPRVAVSGLLFVLATSACGGGDAETSSTSNVDADRPAMTDGQAAEATTACMQGKGWDATFDPRDNSTEVRDVPQAQQSALDADWAACDEELGLDGPAPELTDDQLGELYEHEVATAACLREQGVSVPEAPSEQVFKDTYTSGAAYYAYADLSGVGEDRYYELLELCPQTPEGW